MRLLLYLPLIVTAMFLPGWAAPAVTGIVHASGGFQTSGGPANSSSHVSAGSSQGNSNGGHPNGPSCVTNPQQCSQPIIIINPGPNYQVIQPSTTTVTPNSDATVVATPVVYVPATTPAPVVAVGTVDNKGYVHSPYSNAVLKIDNPRTGQPVHDPTTGQVFYIQMTGTRIANQID